MLEVLGATVKKRRPLVLDIGCGPGSLSSRLIRRLPTARVVAIDNDPVLLQLGRMATNDPADQIRWIDADLRMSTWIHAADLPATVDAILSTTALHWLDAVKLGALYKQFAGLLRPGGVFLNGDELGFGEDEAKIASAARAVHADRSQRMAETETWDHWWLAVESEPGLAEWVTERQRRIAGHRIAHDSTSYAVHREALLRAGFAEVSTVWQLLEDRVLLAIR